MTMWDQTIEIGVLGAGAWGTALAVLANETGNGVVLWGRSLEYMDAIDRDRENARFLPGVTLGEGVRATSELGLLSRCKIVLAVVPSGAMRVVTSDLARCGIDERAVFVSCAKGIEKSTGKRMTEVIADLFPHHPTAVLSGPNHAEEVARMMPAAAVIGSGTAGLAAALQSLFNRPWFRFYTSDDVAGIEWSGAAKNVFAIAAGISGGLGLGDNAKAALVTRGLAEMVRIGVAHHGRKETFQGLSGVGDLVVTCYSEHSRNNRLGTMLGKGVPLDDAVTRMNSVAEGVPNTESIYLAARRAGVRTPLIDAVYAVLYGGRSPREVLAELLARDPRPEVDEQD